MRYYGFETPVSEDAYGDILEGIGQLYGAAGFGIVEVEDEDDDDDLEGAQLGAFLPRGRLKKLRKRTQASANNSATWVQQMYARADGKQKRKLRAAGLNVQNCPDGSQPRLNAPGSDPRLPNNVAKNDRWLCWDQGGCNKSPYMVWSRKKNKWICRTMKVKKKGFFKRVAKGVSKGVSTAAKTAAKTATTVVTAPLEIIAKLALALLLKAALPLAKAVCKMPPATVQIAAAAAGVSAEIVPPFCRAVKVKNWGEVRKMLPGVIKLSVKAAAVASVPGLGPALAIVKTVPGLSQFAGAANPYSQMDPIQVLDSTDYVTLLGASAMISDAELAEGLSGDTKAAIAVGIGGLVLLGGGIFLATRRR